MQFQRRPARALKSAILSLILPLALASRSEASEPFVAPIPLAEPSAEWPAGHALPNDLIVPVVLTVGADGSAELAELEASVGEPFDSAALAAARALRFTPAHDEQGPRSAKLRLIVRFHGKASSATQPPASGASANLRAGAVSNQPASEPSNVASAPTSSAPVRNQQASDAGSTILVQGAPARRSASEAVLDRRLLTLAPHKNASELLLVVPGVFVSQHSGEGKAHQIFFRGFDAVHGQDVEFWAGGAPINDVSNIHGQGYADLHFLIPEVVSEVRSTPGTYDPRQGDFAVAGSMHFGLGYDEPGITAKASLGNFGTRRYFLGYHPQSAPESTFAAFELASTDGFGPSRAARHGSAMVQATHELGNGVSARLLASSYAGRFDSAGVLRLSDIESGAVDRFATYDPKQGGHSTRSQLVFELSGASRARAADDLRPKERWSLSPFLVFRSFELRSDFTGTLKSSEGDSFEQLNDATELGATASYQRPIRLLSASDRLEAGVFLRTDQITQSQHRLSTLNDRVTDDDQNPGVDAEVRASNAAGYVDANLYPVKRLALRAGLRADALSYRTEDRGGKSAGQARSALGGQLSKRGTLDFSLLRGLNALVSYGEGFRSPQARSLGSGETTPFTRVVSYEAGLRFHDETRLESSLAVYRTTLSDDLVFDQATARNELVPGTSRTGVAANLVARPVAWFTSNTSFTYTRALFTASGQTYLKGELLPYVPQFVIRSDIALSPRFPDLLGRRLKAHLGAAFTYVGRKPLPYSEFGHDALLVDARAELRLGPVQTSLDVFNVLGRDWYDGEFVFASRFGSAASLVPVRHVTVGPPRTVLWSLTLFV